MTTVIETNRLGKRYRQLWALADCTLSVPAGHVVGLVGPNGAGKSTLLNLAAGLLAPSAGTIEVLGGPAPARPAQLARVGFLAQDAPAYAALSVADHLKLGARLNPGWDQALARARIDQLDLDPGQKAGTLSGGQRAQLALTLAVAKRPRLLILDEPVASTTPAACKPTTSASSSHQSDPLTCLASNGVQIAVTYQPASRYWAIQWTETAIYLTLALALAGSCFWRLTRRLS